MGMTGVGKTTGNKWLVLALQDLYRVPINILDTKQYDEDFGMFPEVIESEYPPPLNSEGIQVWRPYTDSIDIYDTWFKSILMSRKPRIILVDEVASIVKGSVNITVPEYFERCLKQGRSFGITIITSTQKLSKIPAVAKDQATHVVRYRISPASEYDRRIANALVGRSFKSPEPSGKHSLIYCRIDRPDKQFEYTSFNEFLNGA
jgi:Zonular occludens toxin (Zot)